MASSDIALEKGLPINVDAERFVLGSILLDDTLLHPGRRHPGGRTISAWRSTAASSAAWASCSERGERIDRVTVANELMKFNELESCDGLSYLVSLDDGLPQIPNLDSYIRIVKDKAVLRRIIFASQHMMNRCLLGEEEPGRDPGRRRRDAAQARRGARQDRPASTRARSSRTTRAASTPSSIPASASRASAPASPSSTR